MLVLHESAFGEHARFLLSPLQMHMQCASTTRTLGAPGEGDRRASGTAIVVEPDMVASTRRAMKPRCFRAFCKCVRYVTSMELAGGFRFRPKLMRLTQAVACILQARHQHGLFLDNPNQKTSLAAMSILGRQITSPRTDAVLLFLVGWSLVDASAVPVVETCASSGANLAMRIAVGLVGVASIIAAWIKWKRAA